ncbi:unnamed protein product [Sphagnum balticum]
MRDQSRHFAEGDQPAAGGTLDLVDALSLLNLDALELSALALMLLASQAGVEVKTAIADAGALTSLVAMVDNSNSPMVRESAAAAAIAKLVSCHPVKLSSNCKMWRQSMGIGLKDALPILGHMLESENLEETGTGVGGLQVLVSSD